MTTVSDRGILRHNHWPSPGPGGRPAPPQPRPRPARPHCRPHWRPVSSSAVIPVLSSSQHRLRTSTQGHDWLKSLRPEKREKWLIFRIIAQVAGSYSRCPPRACCATAPRWAGTTCWARGRGRWRGRGRRGRGQSSQHSRSRTGGKSRRWPGLGQARPRPRGWRRTALTRASTISWPR